MADLYNLDAELADEDDDSEEEQQQVVGDNEDDLPQQQQQQWETGNSADDRATYSTNDDAVPDVLQEAARARNRIHARNDYDDNQEGDDYEQQDEEEELEGDDWQQTMTLKSAELQRQNIAYSLLHKAWWQECQSPELCPLDHDTVAEMISCATASLELLNANEEHGAGSHAFVPATNNANITALLESIVRIDAERVKFLLADLFKRRLQKIEAHPLHMRTLTERMSEPEVNFLREYGAAVERHLQTTVTDHFPQDVWKQLDADDMIDEPDLEAFVFVKCSDDIEIGDQYHTKGTCIIVRYERIREFCLTGQVELL